MDTVRLCTFAGKRVLGRHGLVAEMTRLAQERGLVLPQGMVVDFGAGKGQEAVPALVRSFLDIAPGSGKDQREQAVERAESEGIADPEQRVYLTMTCSTSRSRSSFGRYTMRWTRAQGTKANAWR